MKREKGEIYLRMSEAAQVLGCRRQTVLTSLSRFEGVVTDERGIRWIPFWALPVWNRRRHRPAPEDDLYERVGQLLDRKGLEYDDTPYGPARGDDED